MSIINKPSLNPEDALLVARTLKAFSAWRDESHTTRMQSSMRSLRFASRIASKFGIVSRENAYNIIPEELAPDSLVLCDDIRLISVIDNTSVSLANLFSIDIESDPFYGCRAILCFRQINSVYAMIQPPALDTPQLYIVVAGKEHVIEKFVYAVHRSASIYDPIGNLVCVQAPATWTLEPVTLTPMERCEAMHVLICELLHSPINSHFLQQIRIGFDKMFDGVPTLNLVKCLGGQKCIASLSAFELRRDIFAIVFSLYRSAADIFQAVHASNIQFSEDSIGALMRIIDPSKILHIELISCDINAAGFSHFLYRLARAQNSCIRSIVLTGNPIGDSGIASMIEILPAIHPKIEVLKIGRTAASMKSAAALTNLLCNSQLRKLDISGITLNPISAEDVSTGIRCSRFLEHLSVSLGVENVHILFEGLAEAFAPSIKTIVAYGTSINSKGVTALGKYLSKTSVFRSLIIPGTGLTSDRLFNLLQLISTNKNRFPLILDISKNNLKDGVYQAFGRLMDGPNVETGIYNLEGLFLGANGLTGSALKRTCSYLRHLPRLSFVSFDGPESTTNLTNRADDGITLATFISQCPQIRCLSVRRAFGDKGIRAFCKKMSSFSRLDNWNLQTIDVSGNNMGLKAILAFCQFVLSPSGSELVNIDLDDNKLMIEHFVHLGDCLKMHSNVCAINIINDTVAMRESLKDEEVQNHLREILRCLQVVTTVNQARLKEREQEIPFPLHLCLKNIVGLRDQIFDKLAHPLPISDIPLCNRRSVFGVDLHHVASSIPERYDGRVPIVLQLTAKAIDDLAAYEAEGIFRIAPNQHDQAQVRSFLEYGAYPRCNDVHALADVCKQWLRELPTRLFDVFPISSVAAVRTPAEANDLILTIPDPWRSTIRYLLSICAKVVQHSNLNKMTAQALAIVLSPNLVTEIRLPRDEALERLNSVQGFLEKAIIYTVSLQSPRPK